MPNVLEKRTAVYELLRASVPPAEIIRLLKYPRRTVYDIKKRYDAEVAANGSIAEGAGEPSAARMSHSRRRDSLDNLNPEFVRDLQRRMDEDPGRSIVALAGDMGVDRMTISKYLKTHIRYKSYKMRRGGCRALVRLPAGRGPCPQRQGDPGLAECQLARLLGEGVVDAGKPRLQPFGLLLLGGL